MLELGISSLLITVTREESTVLGDTPEFDPAGNKEDGDSEADLFFFFFKSTIFG